MRTSRIFFHATVFCGLLASVMNVSAQDTAFTYQGRLNNLTTGSPANGAYDFYFILWDSDIGGAQQGPILTNSFTAVSNGLFTATLDFGSQFPGAKRWLEIFVRTNGGSFSQLSPRQPLAPTPYAIFATAASNLSGTLPAAQLSGTIPASALAGTYSDAVTLNNPGNSFSGNGAGLTNLNDWGLAGNAGTSSGSFLGTTDNQPLEIKVNGQRVTRYEFNAISPNIIGGLSSNYVAPGVNGATIAGGGTGIFTNSITAGSSTIGGGNGHRVQAVASIVAGGSANTIQSGAIFSTIAGGISHEIGTNADRSTIAGGDRNSVQGKGSFIGGGGYDGTTFRGNTNTGNAAVIGGGLGNFASGRTAVIGGGGSDVFTTAGNVNAGDGATIGGGVGNQILSNTRDSTIAGGFQNQIQSGGIASAIAGGAGNSISGVGSFIGGGGYNFDGGVVSGNLIAANNGVIGGGFNNEIQSGANYSTIGGGQNGTIQSGANTSTIGGGLLNVIQAGAIHSTIGGGRNSIIQANANGSTIAGGWLNTIQTNASLSTIGGGQLNTIQASASASTIGGGLGNVIQTNAFNSTIGGGSQNTIQTNASKSTIGGGVRNVIQTNAFESMIGGGSTNTIRVNADASVISGGRNNTNSGSYATIPGGDQNVATTNAFAAGRRAKANHQGAFVWGDATDADVASTNANSMTFRASGGVRFFSDTNLSAGVFLADGGNSWASISDRNAKRDFATIDSIRILEQLAAIPITRWRYQWETDGQTPHIGPMAQDFKAAFYPGRDDKSITTQELDGVELAAIQGLNQKLEQKDAEIAELKARLERIERLVSENTNGRSR